jgi:hypothetical protein
MVENIFLYFESLGIPRSVVFTVFSSLFTFAAGFIINGMIKWFTRRRYLKKIRKLVILHLDSIQPPINRQAEFFEKLSTDLKSLRHTDIAYEENALCSDYLSSLPQIDLFDALVYGWGKKQDQRRVFFNSVLDILNRFNKLPNATKDTYDYFGEKYNEYFALFNQANDRIQRSYDEFRSEASRQNVRPTDDPFLNEFDNIVSHYQKERKEENPQFLVANYVIPLKELAAKYAADPRALRILPMTIQSKAANENREHLMKLISAYFGAVANKMKEMLGDLNNARQNWM